MSNRLELVISKDDCAQDVLSKGLNTLITGNDLAVASFIQEEAKDINWTKPGLAYAEVVCLLLPYLKFKIKDNDTSVGVVLANVGNKNEKI
ncbi:MAG TPA: hypothetical protein PKI14_01590 [Fervidobacterium sp.]|nr:hypothetical protein [Fervidobacterium sp.]